jgi:pyruvate kinase
MSAALVRGVHAVRTREVHEAGGMIDDACDIAVREGFAVAGNEVVAAAGLPFGRSGTTNLLHVARIGGAP